MCIAFWIIGKIVCFIKGGNTASIKLHKEQFDPNFCWKLRRLWSCPFICTHGLEIAIATPTLFFWTVHGGLGAGHFPRSGMEHLKLQFRIELQTSIANNIIGGKSATEIAWSRSLVPVAGATWSSSPVLLQRIRDLIKNWDVDGRGLIVVSRGQIPFWGLTISRNGTERTGPERTRTPHYFMERNGRYSVPPSYTAQCAHKIPSQ